jgi:hypothetical protein
VAEVDEKHCIIMFRQSKKYSFVDALLMLSRRTPRRAAMMSEMVNLNFKCHSRPQITTRFAQWYVRTGRLQITTRIAQWYRYSVDRYYIDGRVNSWRISHKSLIITIIHGGCCKSCFWVSFVDVSFVNVTRDTWE